MVDKLGTKYVFMFCHLGFGAILILFLLRSLFPGEIIVFVGILTLLFGLVQAASGLAMTSETLVLIPKENKSLATGLWFTLYSGGAGLSGFLSSKVLELNLINPEWSLFGLPMSSYDGFAAYVWNNGTLDDGYSGTDSFCDQKNSCCMDSSKHINSLIFKIPYKFSGLVLQ